MFLMALTWTDRVDHIRAQDVAAGWDEIARTPAGNYAIDYYDRGVNSSYILNFRGYDLNKFNDEQDARTFAQDHFDDLYGECLPMVSS